jgi:phosphomannomutase
VRADLAGIFKAYDIRGLVPEQWDEVAAGALGAAFARLCREDSRAVTRIVVGRDMRETSPVLAGAFAAGITAIGLDVVDIGLVCTDAVYYASGALNAPGAMFTASHNPAGYNGIKLCRAGAVPIGRDTGLARLARLVAENSGAVAGVPGDVIRSDVLPDYAAHLRTLVDVASARPLRVAVDAGNGMAGHVVPTVFAGLPIGIIPLYFELDGTFPNHEPNPIEPANLKDLAAAVVDEQADLGLAFDGDADRCFVVDENGRPISPSAVSGLIAVRVLGRRPGSAVVHNLITSRALPELIAEHGGRPVRTRVGHSFIKAVMAEHDAVFGGEHSGHYYFRDFWFADSGMLAALHVLAALGATPAGTTCSSLMADYERYVSSGEINSTVADPAAALAALRAGWADRAGVRLDELDGLTVSLPDGSWFNVRPSNTEPLLRLNAEAADAAAMGALRDEVLGQIRSYGRL